MKRFAILLAASCTAPPIEVAPVPAGTLRVESLDAFFRFYHDASRPERRKNLAASLAATPEDVDVVCLSGLAVPEDREAILAGVEKRFPHVGYMKTDRSTPPEDPRDDTGKPQKVLDTIPCTDPEEIARLDARVACAKSKCVNAAGDYDFTCDAAACVSVPRPTGPRCSVCWNNATAMGPLDDVHKRCVETPRGELAYDGSLPVAILSRYPLSDVRAHVFPSTIVQRAALSARVEAPRPVHVVCNEIQAWTGAPEIYTGVFAQNDLDGWMVENTLVRARVLDLAHAMAAKGPTVVLGGPMVLFSSNKRGDVNPSADYFWFGANLAPLFTPAPICNLCSDNEVVDRWFRGTFRDFDQLLYAAGGQFTFDEMRLERTEATYSLEGKLGSVGPKFGASVKLTVR